MTEIQDHAYIFCIVCDMSSKPYLGRDSRCIKGITESPFDAAFLLPVFLWLPVFGQSVKVIYVTFAKIRRVFRGIVKLYILDGNCFSVPTIL